MKSFFALVGSLGIIGFVVLFFVPLGLTLYGLYLAFSASIVLGLIALFVEPSPFILGLLAVAGHADIAQRIANWIGL